MTAVTFDIDPFRPGFFLRPDYYDVLARLRAEAPVYEYGPGVKLISRYHDIRAISRDPERFCSSRGVLVNDPARTDAGAVAGSILHMDPPEHREWRRVLSREFTPRAIGRMEPAVRARVIALLDAIPRGEVVDLVDMLAAPLPVQVIADLLDVPDGDRADFRRWSDATIVAADGMEHLSDDDQRSIVEIAQYLEALASAKADAPPAAGLVSLLAHAEIDGRRRSPSELVVFNLSLLVAGNETTRHLISGGLLAFSDSPDQWRALAADPSLASGAVEECLRWVTPVQQFARTATRPTEVGGVPVAEDDYLVLLYASGNRDERAFGPSASMFDVTRGWATPNLAFGFGEHLCLGAALARLEVRVLFEELIARTNGVAIVGEGEWPPSSLVRGPQSLPAVFA
jgi:cytochrome P450